MKTRVKPIARDARLRTSKRRDGFIKFCAIRVMEFRQWVEFVYRINPEEGD